MKSTHREGGGPVQKDQSPSKKNPRKSSEGENRLRQQENPVWVSFFLSEVLEVGKLLFWFLVCYVVIQLSLHYFLSVCFFVCLLL